MNTKKAPMDSLRLLWALRRSTDDANADNRRWKRLLNNPRRTLLVVSDSGKKHGTIGCRSWGRGAYSVDLYVHSSCIMIPRESWGDPIHEVPFHTLLDLLREVQRTNPGAPVILSIDPGTEWALDVRLDGSNWTVQSMRQIPESERPRPFKLPKQQLR